MAMKNQKTCFVTVGATASFSGLVKGVLAPDFLRALEQQEYTDLLIQFGQDGREVFNEHITAAKNSESGSVLNITGFALDKAGLGRYMRQAKGLAAREGVVISHAGSGTILDALRISVPLVVVPNEELLNNHQVELAEALAEQEYVVHGKLDKLAQVLEDAEQLRARHKAWPPSNAGYMRQPKGLKGVVDDEMGFLD
ncbi:glycosyltransferase family 1 protein [Pseudocercospora fijiensis CIRAD86]|uniref:UDP-N-acetylglucosamine transferase subunit ALG13 n=1 Tax=Pseudocercospora fijiensis (strain CIRAD86) TaxID=383855 RepID=M2Z0C1_PSEFD|nr:glycosyltransferase family 1 protein [Pseudocercospora fijiensis CIRAD86]EME83265.1 glycosyltransferase family 1 protein [Pseudocercospora fijiensis CIRAD86]